MIGMPSSFEIISWGKAGIQGEGNAEPNHPTRPIPSYSYTDNKLWAFYN